MRKTLKIFLLVLFGLVIAGVVLFSLKNSHSVVSPLDLIKPKTYPLKAYTFENLKNTQFAPSEITPGDVVSDSADFVSQRFYFLVPKSPKDENNLRVSGLANIPKSGKNHPVIVMFRGYVPKETFASGIGTQPSAKVFASHGYITLAPDFLGYGQSASPSADPFEERFETYTTALTLLSSLQNLNAGLEASYSATISADLSKIGIWGHSNGGHIALATLALSGVKYPTVLWAPVSKSFPYSILYYTDESDDQGKALRRALAKFEEDYDTEQFSPPNYYDWITAPLQINQGTSDQEVPVWWSDDLVKTLKKDKIDVTYNTYANSDHNLLPAGWSAAVTNSLQFFDSHLK